MQKNKRIQLFIKSSIDGEDTLKPRAGSYAATSPSSGSDSRPNTSMAEQRPLSSASGPLPPNSPPWSALSLSTAGGGAGPKKPSKQARQAARQTELKRLRMAQSIQRELEEMEVKQKELEDQGVRLEKALRGEDGGIIESSLTNLKILIFYFTVY